MNFDSFDRIIGVIDVKGGRAVAAVGGQRDQYQPIRAVDGSAERLINHYQNQSLSGIYIADLDAIETGAIDGGLWNVMLAAAAADLTIYADVGRANLDFEAGQRCHRIFSSESFSSIGSATNEPGFQLSSAVSLDYRGEHFLGTAEADWIEHSVTSDLTTIILDLHRVGTSGGPSVGRRCSDIRRSGLSGKLISGGGVRNENELQQLIEAGCDLVLVGTALHPENALPKFA